jgi:eukaryotic-like serine/threonine-protein kinase
MAMALADVRVLGRYALYGEIASGGMATVHLGRLLGPVGFSRTVAIKRLHAQLAKDPEFVAMFMDEARLAARIVHPNVVPMLDVVALDGELFLVMEYVEGEPLGRLLRTADERGQRVPLRIIATILTGVLHGLHAAHEAKNDRGEPLGIVHRDVSPHNVLVGLDGVPRLLDFGIAKAAGRVHTTREGQLKGKLPYMAPEQIRGNPSRLSDVYASGVVLWEALAGRRLFKGDEAEVLAAVLEDVIEPPSRYAPDVPPALDALALRALDRNPLQRFPSAREMAQSLELATPSATATEVREWLEGLAGASLAERRKQIAELESAPTDVPTSSAKAAPRTRSFSTRGGVFAASGIALAIGGVALISMGGRTTPTPASTLPPLPTGSAANVVATPDVAPLPSSSTAPLAAASTHAPMPPAARTPPRKSKNPSAPIVPNGSRLDRVIDSRN